MDLSAVELKPLRLLTGAFITWKAVILIITLTAPGPGYDTCSTFLNLQHGPAQPFSAPPPRVPTFLTKFVRWDAIYYTHVAQRGHLYEQEWAFGVGLSSTLRWLAKRLFFTSQPELYQVVITGILLSHGMHYASMILLYYIASLIVVRPRRLPSSATPPNAIPTLTALLYIISPAGIILSAPYSEALFAFRNFLGLLIYIIARRTFAHSTPFASFLTILSGLVLSMATAVRPNGLLSGIPILIDFLATFHVTITASAQTKTLPHPSSLAKILALLTAGLLIATGQILPQIKAYQQFCTSPSAHLQSLRPWCAYTIPSIFTFVQHHYWNVGLFNYWEIGNLPLFTLAAPTITLLVYSSGRAIQHFRTPVLPFPSNSSDTTTISTNKQTVSELQPLSPSESFLLSLPQLILAVAAIFSYHIQIITRLSSGYPWWYIWLASYLLAQEQNGTREKWWKFKAEWVARWMMLYAMIQAGLYASFLPPA